jgi:hypothetical protein
VFLNYGKNKEGYWTYEHFVIQMVRVILAIEFLYPDMQILVEVDHSSGHGKSQAGGLNVNNMGTGYGGKQDKLHNSKVSSCTCSLVHGGEGDQVKF